MLKMNLHDVDVRARYHLDLMTERGFKVDYEKLYKVLQFEKYDLEVLAEEIWNESDAAILKANSARQVGEFLESQGIVVPRTMKGNYSISVESLELIDHPIIPKLIEYRKKLSLAGQLESVLNTIENGRVHPQFDTESCATGRIYSKNPNVMGWSPKALEAIVPDDGYSLFVVDYKAQELRILAGLAGCKNLIKAFANGEDPHRTTAQYIFQTEDVTDEQRKVAKVFNFATLYGQTVEGLARKLNISVEEAQVMQGHYFGAYPEIRDFQRKAIRFARQNGYTSTLYGRRRNLNYNVPQSLWDKLDRQAVNTWIQGTAADVIRYVLAALPHTSDKFDVLFPVHDSLFLQLRNDCDPEKFKAYIEKVMVQTIRGVRLEVEWKVG